MLAAGLLFLSLSLLTTCRPHTRHGDFAVRSQRSEVPAGFSLRTYPLLPNEPLELILIMPQSDTIGLHTALLDVSDPIGENYGRHLSKDEVARYVAPHVDSIGTVDDWLTSNGISSETCTGSENTLRLRIPVHQANSLLDASFAAYVHDKTNTTLIRTLSYSLPANIHDHIVLIHPTTQFVVPVDAGSSITQRSAESTATCKNAITPRCLQALYSIPTAPATASGNSLYVTGFGGATSSGIDLKAFLTQYRPDIGNETISVMPIHDTSSSDGPGSIEGNFDIQYTVGLATNVPVTFVTIGNLTSGIPRQDLLDMVITLLDQETVPLVLTTSYVFDEMPDDPEFVAFAHTLCNAYAQLGARGTSVLFASGDGGVAGGLENDDDCEDKAFVAAFPSGCPFVTSVGATQNINPEVAAPFTSGGFSQIFPRPKYQQDAVDNYLTALGDAYAGRYNASGRAFPDVSAHGVNYLFEMSGAGALFRGTSASSPTFASIIALINDRLLSAGKRPLGFLNPLLYSKGRSAFTDVTSGSNPGCGTHGFPAMEGWDPVTGLGTPDFNRLLTAVSGSVVASSVENSASQLNIMSGMLTMTVLLFVLAAW